MESRRFEGGILCPFDSKCGVGRGQDRIRQTWRSCNGVLKSTPLGMASQSVAPPDELCRACIVAGGGW